MKKVLSIMVALMMLVALAVPAFAADEDNVSYLPAINSVTYEGLEADKHIEIRAADPNDVNEDTLKAKAAELLESISGIEVVDIVCVETATNAVVELTTPVTVSFAYDKTGNIGAVLIQNADESWSEVPFTMSGNTLTLDLPHLTPVSIVLGVPTTPGSGSGSGSGSGIHMSPQTGYNTEMWTVITIVMVLCAGCCFVSARKKVAE